MQFQYNKIYDDKTTQSALRASKGEDRALHCILRRTRLPGKKGRGKVVGEFQSIMRR